MVGKELPAEFVKPKVKIDGNSTTCWRKEVDENLKRLQSLLFGTDAALEKGDFCSAQVLALGLIGFLDSRTHSPIDEAFIRPIFREAASKLGLARHRGGARFEITWDCFRPIYGPRVRLNMARGCGLFSAKHSNFWYKDRGCGYHGPRVRSILCQKAYSVHSFIKDRFKNVFSFHNLKK